MRFATSAVFVMLVGCRQIVGIEQRQVYDDADGSDSACGIPIHGAACASCMTAKCCPLATQCNADATCNVTEQCAYACATGDSSCRLGCSKKWGPVNDAQAKLQLCRDDCADECGPWECLGKVSWQIPDVFPESIKIQAIAKCKSCSPIGGSDPNPGVHVRVCSTANPYCPADTELSRGDTDQDGSVSLTVETHGNPLSVFLEFHKDGFLDDLLMLNTPPLSSDFDVGFVYMDQSGPEAAQLFANLNSTYDPALAIVKLRLANCNLQSSTGVDLIWPDQDQVGATIANLFNKSEWDVIAVNLPVGDPTPRLVARLKSAASEDGATAPPISVVTLVLRKGAITLAPFVTPTP